MRSTANGLDIDWDKLRIFHAAAEAGSFTHAGDRLGMSQSAVSRQVSALEKDLKVALFHRHARGLVLTEQGELLFRTARDVVARLRAAATQLADTKAKPSGELKVTTPVGLGSAWVTPRIGEFIELYPDIRLQFILTDEELDLPMRQADVAIWLFEPTQNDLIRRPLFDVQLKAYASPRYLLRYGTPKRVEDLDEHRIITYDRQTVGPLREMNWLEKVGREAREPRRPVLSIDNVYGLKQAVRRGVGIGVLPDYMHSDEADLVQVLSDVELPEFTCYFVYPDELKSSKRVHVFRDFLVAKAKAWKA